MRYAIISDIHGNLEALKKVLRSIKIHGVDEIICLGDIVGYGSDPNACVERIMKAEIKTVVGNHDYAAVDESIVSDFNDNAKLAIAWTRSILSRENLEFLACLPVRLKISDILMIHSSPSFPLEWNYILDPITALGEFGSFQEKIAFVGHSHRPVIFSSDGNEIVPTGETVYSLQEEIRYIINVGSVGQPRDFDQRASYGIFDTERLTFTLFRVEYKIKKTAAKIKNNGLPEFLAKRLFLGR